MSLLVARALSSVIAVLLLLVAHWLLQPAPVPALTAVVGGLLGMWLGGRSLNISSLASGATAGLLLGVLMHLYSHVAEGRLQEPPEGILLHLLYDGLEAAVVSAAILIVCGYATRRLASTEP